MRYGADMVSILNSSENDFIYTEIPKVTNKRWFWIGLFRNITTGDPNVDWIWSDGNNFTNPEQWGAGQPNNHNDRENCARIFTDDDGWHDYDCTNRYSSICKKRKGTLISVISPAFLSLFSH